MASRAPIAHYVSAAVALTLLLPGRALTVGPLPSDPAQNPVAVASLQAYVEGRHDEATNGLRSLLPLPNLVRELERAVDRSGDDTGVPVAAPRPG